MTKAITKAKYHTPVGDEVGVVLLANGVHCLLNELMGIHIHNVILEGVCGFTMC